MTSSIQSRLGTAPEEGCKAPCVTVSTTNITLSGEQTIGSVAVVTPNRVLVDGQTDPAENGIYNVSNTAWTYAKDWNKENDVVSGMLVPVSELSLLYQLDPFTGSYTAGTTDITFSVLPATTTTTITHDVDGTDYNLATYLQNRHGVNVRDFGALGDGVNDDTRLINNAMQYGMDNDLAVHIPSGTYILTSLSGFGGIRLFSWTGSSGRFCAFGDGATTVLKMKDGTIIATGQSMIDLRPDADMEHILFKDMVLDMNGQNMSTHPGGGAWEQSHTLRYAGETGFTTKLLEYNNVIIKNRIADGMNNQGVGRITDWKITDCSDDRIRLYTRSSIQQSRMADTLTITNFVGESIESEPTLVPTVPGKVIIDGCSVERLDAAAVSIVERTTSEYYISNTVVSTQATFSQTYFRVTGGKIKIASDGLIKYPVKGSSFSNCKILLPYDSGTTTLTPLQFQAQAGEFGTTFNDCEILADTDYVGNITGQVVSTNLACPVADVDNWNWEFNNCKFDVRAENTAVVYRGGTWDFNNCDLIGHVAAFSFSNSVLHGNKLYVNGGNCEKLTGVFMTGAWAIPDQSTTITQAYLSGDYYGVQAGVISTLSGGPNLQLTTMIVSSRNLNLAALPVSGFKGDVVSLPHTALGMPAQYQCTAQSISVPNYRMVRQTGVNMDVTGSRPTLTANDVGLMYLDTTLDADGHPIWWTGTAWVDAQGLVV